MELAGLENVARHNVCAVCAGELTVAWNGKEYHIRCGINRNHRGYERRPDWVVERLQRLKDRNLRIAEEWGATDEELAALAKRLDEDCIRSISTDHKVDRKRWERRPKVMVDQMTEEQRREIAPYVGVTSLTVKQAKKVLQAVFPGAPDEALIRGSLFCAQYGLNPLAKHIYLIPFKTKEGERWEIIRGINSDRLLASRRVAYSYVDDTPRFMTDDEQIKDHGEVDEGYVWAITKLETVDGRTVTAAGKWPENEEPYGKEKGNTKLNMAKIRSEREALTKLCPGEMPTDIQVMDDRYIDAKYTIIEEEETQEQKSEETSKPPVQGFHPWMESCPIHEGESWSVKNGILTHTVGDHGNCTFLQAMAQMLYDAHDKLGEDLSQFKNPVVFANHVSTEEKGKGWGQISNEEMLTFVLQAMSRVDAAKSQKELWG